jgi:colicin import membrane protein
VAVVALALLIPGLGAGAGAAARPAARAALSSRQVPQIRTTVDVLQAVSSANHANHANHAAAAKRRAAAAKRAKATAAKKAAKARAAKAARAKAARARAAKARAAKARAAKAARAKAAKKKAATKPAGSVVGAAPGALDTRTLPTSWLARVNAYRAAIGSPPVVELSSETPSLLAHAQYLVATGATGHTEDPSQPAYSAAGAHGGSVSDVLTSSQPMSEAAVVDQFINAPFHAFALLDPQLSAISFASFTNTSSTSGNEYAALLDVIDGQSGGRFLGSGQALWPSPGSVVTALTASDEWPNPTSSCPGGAIPAAGQGTPIWAMLNQFPSGLLQAPAHTTVTGASLMATGPGGAASIPVCLVTQDNWHGDDPTADTTGRTWLQLVDGAIIVPLQPLTPGTTYDATLTGPSGQLANWSFQTA